MTIHRMLVSAAFSVGSLVGLGGCMSDPSGMDAEPIDPTKAERPGKELALCEGFGPQTPRDIAQPKGENPMIWSLAPEPEQLSLCNIHTHTNAEHKGPGFAMFAGPGTHGGYQCNETAGLSEVELEPVPEAQARFGNVKPGDTIEVHWVYSSCNVSPGPGLESCLSDQCANPELRVESQVFLLVNDSTARDFREFTYGGTQMNGRPQPAALPEGTGTPVVFAGSTTGPSYTQSTCSPLLVTWSVRPQCTRLDINSLHAWGAAGNVFEETASHGVRQRVTAPELLAPIE